jgi:hypothetical protein
MDEPCINHIRISGKNIGSYYITLCVVINEKLMDT